MLRDDIRELRRTVLESRQAAEDVWPRLADDLASNPRPHFIAKAAESCEEGPSVSVEVITPIEGEVEIGETLRVANVYSSFTQYAVLPQHQKMLVVRGDHPRWQPNTGYAGGDLVTYDNGSGLKRWERDSSGTSGATFDAGDWTEIEAATGWRIGYLFEHVAVATATTDHDGLDGKSFNAELDDSSPAIELVDVLNPLGQDVATDDKVLIYFWGQDLADAANTPFLILSESSLGGGGADTDELFKVSADDTTAGYFETKMANSGTYNASNHNLVYRETINGGSNETFRLFTAKATAPAADNDRLVLGLCTADVNVDDASFTIDNTFALADGDTPAASLTVHDPIASYKNNDLVLAVWFDSAGEWRDITPSRYGILKGTVDEASGVTLGEDNWTVDGLEIQAGSRDPGTSSVQVYGAKQAYADNAEVTIIWSDENERWEDFTDVQGGSHIAFISPNDGAVVHEGESTADLMTWNNGTEQYDDTGTNVNFFNFTGRVLSNGVPIPAYRVVDATTDVYVAISNSSASIVTGTASGASNDGNNFDEIHATSLTGWNGEVSFSIASSTLYNPLEIPVATGDKVMCVGDYNGFTARWAIVNVTPAPRNKIGKTVGTITARSGSTAGKGTVDIYEIDTSDDSLDDKAVANETWYNLADETIADDTWVMGKAVTAKDGTLAYFIDWEQCSS